MADLPLPNSAAELEAVLAQMNVPNTEAIARATAILKKFLSNVNSVLPLLEQVAKSSNVVSRNMAAVVLRSKISSHWKRLSPPQRAQVQAILLERLGQEPHRLVRLSIASLVSAVAKHTIPVNEWPDLLDYLLSMSQSQEAQHREVSMMLFRLIADSMGPHLRPHFGTLQAIFHKGLQDAQSPKVRLEALQALSSLVEFVSSPQEVLSFQPIIPTLVEFVKLCLATDGEDADVAALATFEVFTTLAETSVPVLDDHIKLVLSLMLQITVERSFTINFRDAAADFVSNIAENKPRALIRHDAIGDIVRAAFMLFIETYDDQVAADVVTPQKMAVNILDTLIMAVPKQLVFDIVLNNALQLTRSNSAHERKGGMLVMAVLAEGCDYLLTPNLEQLLSVVFAAVKDPEPLVRSAAYITLSQFADHLQPDISQYHEQILPHIFMALDNAAEAPYVRLKACIALDSMTETLSDAIVPYLGPLVGKLVGLITSTAQTSPDDLKRIRQTALSALKSTAFAARGHFAKYGEPCLRALDPFLRIAVDDPMVILRAVAMECVGTVLLALGRPAGTSLVERYLQLAAEGANAPVFELREHTFNFFMYVSELLGAETGAILPVILPPVLAAILSDDGVMVYLNEADAGMQLGQDPLGGGDSDSEDEDEYSRVNISIRSGALDEKVAALGCLEQLLSVCEAHLLPHLARVMDVVKNTAEYPHAAVRHAVVEAMHELLRFANRAWPVQNQGLSQEVQVICEGVFPTLLLRMHEDKDKPTVARAVGAITEAIQFWRMPLLNAYGNRVVELLNRMLEEKAPCQVQADTEYIETEILEHDEILIDQVTDCVAAIAEAGGAEADSVLAPLMTRLTRFLGPERPKYDRSMAIGCYGEICSHLGPGTRKYAESILPYALRGISDPEIFVRRNSAFTLGVLFQYASDLCAPAAEAAITGLAALFQPIAPVDGQCAVDEADFFATRDNAVSALAKIISANVPSVPLAKCVQLFLSGLPLTHDFEEAKYVYPCLAQLFGKAPELMLDPQYLAVSVPAMARAMTQDELAVEYKEALLNICRELAKSHAAKLQAVMGSMDPQLRQALSQLLG